MDNTIVSEVVSEIVAVSEAIVAGAAVVTTVATAVDSAAEAVENASHSVINAKQTIVNAEHAVEVLVNPQTQTVPTQSSEQSSTPSQIHQWYHFDEKNNYAWTKHSDVKSAELDRQFYKSS